MSKPSAHTPLPATGAPDLRRLHPAIPPTCHTMHACAPCHSITRLLHMLLGGHLKEGMCHLCPGWICVSLRAESVRVCVPSSFTPPQLHRPDAHISWERAGTRTAPEDSVRDGWPRPGSALSPKGSWGIGGQRGISQTAAEKLIFRLGEKPSTTLTPRIGGQEQNPGCRTKS